MNHFCFRSFLSNYEWPRWKKGGWECGRAYCWIYSKTNILEIDSKERREREGGRGRQDRDGGKEYTKRVGCKKVGR
jgi:hypothetical protein